MSDYFESHLSSSQHGFRTDRSTSTALADLVSFVERHRAKKFKTTALAIDIARAFDSIDHSILLGKLRHYGMSEKAVGWFQSYLSQRTMFVG